MSLNKILQGPIQQRVHRTDKKRKEYTRAAVALLLTLLFALPATVFAATPHLRENAQTLITKTENAYGGLIDVAALLHDTDPDLILAVIVVESEGNPRALSRRGAEGLMQLMPQTAKAMGVTDRKEPLQNILAGTKYLKDLEDRYAFIDSTEEALVAYNMGPTRARHWLARFTTADSSYVAQVMYVYRLIKARDHADMLLVNAGVKKLAEGISESVFAEPRPILTRPRALSLAAFPMNLPSGRRDEVKSDN